MRIGVVADSHVGEHLPRIPREALSLLDGVDLILHAGDLSVPWALDELREIAPVRAVRGNHDRGELRRSLPRDVVVQAGGARIGLTHGDRRAAVELPSGVLSVAAGRPVLVGFARAMAARFDDVAMVVTGHLHLSIDTQVDGVRVFSPGALYVPELRRPGQMRPWTAWLYGRYRGALSEEERRPAIGIIEVAPDGLTARRIALEEPIVPLRRRQRGATAAGARPSDTYQATVRRSDSSSGV